MAPQRLAAVYGSVTSICPQKGGGVWAGTATNGAYFVSSSGEVTSITFGNTAGGLRSNNVYAVFVDRENVIWLGTDRGVCRYDPQSPFAEKIAEIPDSNFVWALCQSRDKRVWAGTNRGLFVRAPNSRQWSPVIELADRKVYSIVEQPNQTILAGSDGGLYALEKGVELFTKIERPESVVTAPDSVRSICRFQGAVYIANFGRGLERLDGTDRVVVWPLDSGAVRERDITSLYSDRDQRLWIGTAEAGVFAFDGKRVSTDPELNQLQGAAIRGISGSTEEGLWFATSRGLYHYESNRLVSSLEGNDVRGIAHAADGSVWAGTTGSGIFKVSRTERSSPAHTRLDQEHGLPSDQVFAIIATQSTESEEVVWVGTNRGIVSYRPGTVAPLLKISRILADRVYQPQETVGEWGLRLPYPQNSLLVEVAATSSRTFPEQFQYSYLLRGPNRQVIREATSHDSQFLMEHLQPGRYAVEIRAFSANLIASEPSLLEFEVAGAPFPITITALSVLLTFALVALWWGYRQNRKLAEMNRALAGANRQLAGARMQLAQETENERSRIARDLHDQTLADLRRLLLLTDQIPKTNGEESKQADPGILRAEIESISTEIRRICEDLSPSTLANVGLTAALEWALSDAVAHLPIERRFEYRFVCESNLEDRVRLGPVAEIQVYRIIQEAISNVCRHSGASEVVLSADVRDGKFIVTLEDNGCGFDASSKTAARGRGLNNIRSRASLIDAQIEWSARPDGGTVFRLSRPVQ
jgi:signal transduction histidine kinase